MYPLVICYSLLLKMAIEIVDLPINSMVIFHSYVTMVFGGVVATMEIFQPQNGGPRPGKPWEKHGKKTWENTFHEWGDLLAHDW